MRRRKGARSRFRAQGAFSITHSNGRADRFQLIDKTGIHMLSNGSHEQSDVPNGPEEMAIIHEPGELSP